MNKSPKQKEKKDKDSGFYVFAIVCALIVIFFTVFARQIGAFPVVAGKSMYPTLDNGDLLYMSVSHHKDISEIERGDIVVIEKEDGSMIIKRVIGLPNEVIQMTNNKVYINGVDIADEYNFSNGGVAEIPIQLGEDEFFVCGDNRDNSADSRMDGAYTYDQIKGIVLKVLIDHK